MNGVSSRQMYWVYSGMTWITAGGTTHVRRGPTTNVIVRNNIAPLIAATAAASGNCPVTESFLQPYGKSKRRVGSQYKSRPDELHGADPLCDVQHQHGPIQSRVERNGGDESSNREGQRFPDACDRFSGPFSQPCFPRSRSVPTVAPHTTQMSSRPTRARTERTLYYSRDRIAREALKTP